MVKKIIKRLFESRGYRVFKGVYRPTIEDPYYALQSLCPTDTPCIFDVGAYYGNTVIRFRDLLPKCTVYAFEPFKESFDHLAKTVANDTHVKAFNLGLADTSGEKPFSANKSSATNSILETDEMASTTWGPDLVETEKRATATFTTVDRFVSEHGIGSVDILKLDAQGSEPLVMEGARETLKAGIVKLILTEMITRPTYKGQQKLSDALAMYESAGFRLHNFFEPGYTAKNQLSQIDALFVHASLE